MTTVVEIRPNLILEELAAKSWVRMETEKGSELDVNRSTVSRAEQFKKYYAFLNDPKNEPLALHPDKSWHCEPRARAVDTDDDVWIREHPDHGWRFVVDSEKWHAQYYPEHDKYLNSTASDNVKPLEKDEEMKPILLQLDPNVDGRYVVINYSEGTYWTVRNGWQLDRIKEDSNVRFIGGGGQPMNVIDGLKEVPK